MSDIAVHTSGLAKRYRLGEREPYKSIRDSIVRRLSSPLRGLRPNQGSSLASQRDRGYIWALQDISFDIRRGEVVGIIGRNGAGKSTLLKILSRVTDPTDGAVDMYGRVGSLLEVGTGFHPELTGRENIYLSGAILGMSRRELDRKFNAIVDFAEVHAFIDTPVKRYSSGMYVRLAFAVAVHIETEILLVDEVLAVGDAQFQEKCFRKLRSIRDENRTILFVSHNMSAIRNICTRALLLNTGRVVGDGPSGVMADRYVSECSVDSDVELSTETSTFHVEQVVISSEFGASIKTFDPIVVRVALRAKRRVQDPGLHISVLDMENRRLAGLDLKDFADVGAIEPGERVELGFKIESLPLMPGRYLAELYVKDMATYAIELVPALIPFEVAESPVYGGRKLDSWFGIVGLHAEPIVERQRSFIGVK